MTLVWIPNEGKYVGQVTTSYTWHANRYGYFVPIREHAHLKLNPFQSLHKPHIYYIFPDVQRALDQVAADYYKLMGGKQPLGVNAASLRWGGLHDIDDDWNPTKKHAAHRTGRDLDLEDGANNNYRVLIDLKVFGEKAGFALCAPHGKDPKVSGSVDNHVHCEWADYPD